MNMEENDQLLLKDLIEKILRGIDPPSDRNTHLDHNDKELIEATLGEERRLKKERQLLSSIDELENENQLLRRKIIEQAEDKLHIQKRVDELEETVEEKKGEIKRVLHEKETFQKEILAKVD